MSLATYRAQLYEPDNILVKDGTENEDDPPVGDKIVRRDPPPPIVTGKVKIMEGERIAFTEEGQPGQYLKLVASGEVDDTMLEALEDYVKRQRKRLKAAPQNDNSDKAGNG